MKYLVIMLSVVCFMQAQNLRAEDHHPDHHQEYHGGDHGGHHGDHGDGDALASTLSGETALFASSLASCEQNHCENVDNAPARELEIKDELLQDSEATKKE